MRFWISHVSLCVCQIAVLLLWIPAVRGSRSEVSPTLTGRAPSPTADTDTVSPASSAKLAAAGGADSTEGRGAGGGPGRHLRRPAAGGQGEDQGPGRVAEELEREVEAASLTLPGAGRTHALPGSTPGLRVGGPASATTTTSTTMTTTTTGVPELLKLGFFTPETPLLQRLVFSSGGGGPGVGWVPPEDGASVSRHVAPTDDVTSARTQSVILAVASFAGGLLVVALLLVALYLRKRRIKQRSQSGLRNSVEVNTDCPKAELLAGEVPPHRGGPFPWGAAEGGRHEIRRASGSNGSRESELSDTITMDEDFSSFTSNENEFQLLPRTDPGPHGDYMDYMETTGLVSVMALDGEARGAPSYHRTSPLPEHVSGTESVALGGECMAAAAGLQQTTTPTEPTERAATIAPPRISTVAKTLDRSEIRSRLLVPVGREIGGETVCADTQVSVTVPPGAASPRHNNVQLIVSVLHTRQHRKQTVTWGDMAGEGAGSDEVVERSPVIVCETDPHGVTLVRDVTLGIPLQRSPPGGAGVRLDEGDFMVYYAHCDRNGDRRENCWQRAVAHPVTHRVHCAPYFELNNTGPSNCLFPGPPTPGAAHSLTFHYDNQYVYIHAAHFAPTSFYFERVKSRSQTVSEVQRASWIRDTFISPDPLFTPSHPDPYFTPSLPDPLFIPSHPTPSHQHWDPDFRETRPSSGVLPLPPPPAPIPRRAAPTAPGCGRWGPGVAAQRGWAQLAAAQPDRTRPKNMARRPSDTITPQDHPEMKPRCHTV